METPPHLRLDSYNTGIIEIWFHYIIMDFFSWSLMILINDDFSISPENV